MKVTLAYIPDIAPSLFATGISTGKSYTANSETDIIGFNDKSYYEAFEKAIKAGHHSLLEHTNMTFLLENVSRALLAQMTRHRLVSYTVRSQRYCNESESKDYYPDSIINNAKALPIYMKSLREAKESYIKLVNLGIPKEDARFVLPNSTFTTILMTVNAREFIHICKLRLCGKAQAEIRQCVYLMREKIKDYIPIVYKMAVPPCGLPYGKCKETKPCKIPWKSFSKSV